MLIHAIPGKIHKWKLWHNEVIWYIFFFPFYTCPYSLKFLQIYIPSISFTHKKIYFSWKKILFMKTCSLFSSVTDVTDG